ncbi:MAG TPA: methyltransferase domain-containing protein [Hanamia sp.]|nr:methyltransferase domain-containing protein [Hanamia sp.]
MTLQEGIALIKTDKIDSFKAATWADLGCGSGLFTNALASLLADESTIYAVDKNLSSFHKDSSLKSILIKPVELNFERTPLPFNNLDGILMANSLHYVKNKKDFFEKIKTCLNANGCFLIVEYDMEIANHWVPYPISFLSLKKLFHDVGFSFVEKISERPSAFNRGNLFSAIVKHT